MKILDTSLDVVIGLSIGFYIYFNILKPKYAQDIINKIQGVE
jgi:hypothetical protein